MTDVDMGVGIDEEDDPIVCSYDIFVKPHISDGREIYVLQFPNRDIDQRYSGSNDAQPLKFRTKPKAGMVEMDVPIDARRNYDKDKGVKWGDAIKKSNMVKGGEAMVCLVDLELEARNQLAGGGRAQDQVDPERVIPVDKNSPTYFLGAFQNDKLHLTPIDHMVQMRPQFHHIDAYAEQEKQNRPREGPAPRITEARAVHMTVKSNIDGEGDGSDDIGARIAAAQQEPWQKHRYVDEDHPAAWDCYHENMFIYSEQLDESGKEKELSTETVPKLITGMDDMAYIDTISAPNNAAKMSRAKVDAQTVDLDDDEEDYHLKLSALKRDYRNPIVSDKNKKFQRHYQASSAYREELAYLHIPSSPMKQPLQIHIETFNMAYLAPIHRPSSVRLTLRLNLLDSHEECLVLAKANRLEIWRATEEGLEMAYSKPIYGRISMLQKIQPAGSKTDHLFVGTVRAQYFTVMWNPATQKLDTMQSFVDVSQESMRDSESRDRCLVDPTGRLLVMELYEGVLNLVKIVKPRGGKTDYLDKPEQVRISEMRVRASAFLYTDTKQPKLALLYQDAREEVKLATYRMLDEKGHLVTQFDPARDRENDLDGLCLGAMHIIPVPKGADEGSKRYIFTYLDDESKAVVEYPLDEAVLWAAWEPIDERIIYWETIMDFYTFLTILVNGATVTGMKVVKLGQVSKPTSLENMGNGIFYVGSHEADTQVIRIDFQSSPDQSIKVLQKIPNIAPILDFTVMDMGGRDGETKLNEYSSGQARLVTGSGGFEGGSLRSVRSGVGLDDIGILAEMDGIRKVFALHSGPSLPNDTLVVSFSTETRFFKFDNEGEIEEIITAASGNQNYVLLSSNGRTLVSLSIQRNLAQIAYQELGDDQAACVHVSQVLGNIGVVGLWKSGSVSLLDIRTLNTIVSEKLRRTDGASVPRDIALTQILPPELSGPTLFVSMEDGVVLSFDVDKDDYSLSSRKSIVLGTRQAQLQILSRDDTTFKIFATCEHPTLIYGSEGRTVYSAITAEAAVAVCSFDGEAFPNSVVIATADELKLAVIDNERRTHVTTLPIGETVRRIAYSARERAFAIGSIKRELTKGQESITTSFRIVDEVMFGELGEPFYLPQNNEIIESVIRAELPTTYGDGELVERFLVGTSFLHDTEINIRGRLLIFAVNNDRTPHMIAERSLKGSCRCIGVLDGKIVAALNKTVVMYDYEETSSASANLTKIATYRCSTCPIDIDITGNIIAVADIMKSVALVEYTPGVNGSPAKLQEVGRHSQQVFATSVAEVDTDTYLESDHDGNLIVLKRNREGVTEQDKLRLEVLCEMNLGEMVNRIKKVNIDISKDALLIPRAFVGTTEGSIYLFSLIPPQNQDILMRLQSQLASLPTQSLSHPDSYPGTIEFSPGNLDFNRYRSYVSAVRETSEPFRFIDGDLIELFLDLRWDVQELLGKALGVPAEDLRGLVEGLRRLR
ncbi:hypothetical protein DID88_006444 [Monilinia fructigena]|uniref:DNA damage-binding protein 1 n=1 Tax=Monilinia fructigena TaxID=38457 RepID=A0A395IGV9_9HELO|nr:hypothetical protein DID88_006444 [Monilinia fructigena]